MVVVNYCGVPDDNDMPDTWHGNVTDHPCIQFLVTRSQFFCINGGVSLNMAKAMRLRKVVQ